MLLLLILLQAGGAPKMPAFTEAEVAALERCVDARGPGADVQTCGDFSRDVASVQGCLQKPGATEACFRSVMEDCAASVPAADEARNARVIRWCAARGRGANQAVAAAWMSEAQAALPPAQYASIKSQYDTVARQADAEAARKPADDLLGRSGARSGVWEGWLAFMWSNRGSLTPK